MRLFFSAGEASGDAYVGALASRLAGPDVRMEGIVGARGEESGVEPVASNRDWGAIGIVESLKVAPRIRKGYYRALAALAQGQPGVCIPVDFGYMNIRLAQRAKSMGWKVLYFSPPGSWRRDKQGADLPLVADEIVTPFPWSAEILSGMGASAHWFGHPLRQMVAESTGGADPRRGVAILPGSRLHEVQNNIPAVAQALKDYAGPIRLSRAPNVSEPELLALWGRNSAQVATTETDLYPLLKSAESAIVCSGTATLESALCGCPTVVVYRGGRAMEIEYRIRRPKFDYISLPNILLQRPLLKELIQWDATPLAIRDSVLELLGDTPARRAQLAGFAELEALLGPADALDRTAQLIREMAG